ncbi:uncharacterized protein LOC143219711 [Lasioglossum baleicum]|uniref:uncharacterized protein LOC143219711 n=1 Tax=Lasioglossum baleicum TaxID=434251 RepID=UPI003FCC8347
MDDLQRVIVEQERTITQIERALPNLKKVGVQNYTTAKVKNRMKALDVLWDRCQQLDTQLHQESTEADRIDLNYFATDAFSKAEDVYLTTTDYMSEILHTLTNHPSTHTAGDDSKDHTKGVTGRKTKLSRIDVPTFSGVRIEWEDFRDMFQSMVINDETLTNVERLHYLKASLTGAALKLLSNIRITESNFTHAWKKLNDEFENTRLLITTHLSAIADTPVMKYETADGLRALRDTADSSITALKNLGRPVDNWDDWLVHTLSQKLAPRTRHEWNLKLGESYDPPTWEQFIAFINTRMRGLDGPSTGTSNASRTVAKTHIATVQPNSATTNKCPHCSGSHPLYRCDEYNRADLQRRLVIVKRLKCCVNCLRKGHCLNECRSQSRCYKCSQAHHTSLHRDTDSSMAGRNPPTKISTPASASAKRTTANGSENAISNSNDCGIDFANETSLVHTVLQTQTRAQSVILATARVILRTVEGRMIQTKALLDQGSTYSFISETLAQTLRTRRQKTSLTVNCFGDTYSGKSKSFLNLGIEPVHGKGPSLPINVYVFQRITSYAATKTRPVASWPHLQGLELADPEPFDNCPIHLLIGADLYGAILLNDLRQGPFGSPTAQLTIFGWILSGPSTGGESAEHFNVASIHMVNAEADELLKRFWETEEVVVKPHLTEDEKQCERHFRETHQRDEAGRYVVRLPFKTFPPPIGESLTIATRQYTRLERRLERDTGHAQAYHDFLAKYRELGHMEFVPLNEQSNVPAVYLPHHPVIKEHSLTTKLRVVFNASCATSNGTSLNTYLQVGPKLQNELFAVIARWRQHQFVLTADVAKMFRQIRVHPLDCDYQRILWRPPGSDVVRPCRLTTVTYGTACAPYLAIRVLNQLADDEGDKFPLAKTILQQNIYVDDVLFGADDINTAREMCRQLQALLLAGGFHLHKWSTNDPTLFTEIPQGEHEVPLDHPLEVDTSLKILGVAWSPRTDTFLFKTHIPGDIGSTKRTVLSSIAKLFDPLGWATPIVITAKMLIQELWMRERDWDERLPADLLEKWQSYCRSLQDLNEIRIPRWTGVTSTTAEYELHGFSDASSRAFAAAVYIRVIQANTSVKTTLIAAKSKVAPLKTLSIPRLELNAAVLLSKLIESILSTLQCPTAPIYCWTDSTVVLDWMNKHPSTWNTFVANRVADIQSRLPSASWRHVPTASNPADCASRGILPSELRDHALWWHGPPWLGKSPQHWPARRTDCRETDPNHDATVIAELRGGRVHTVAPETTNMELPEQFSSWPKLLRVTAYILRFITNARPKQSSEPKTLTRLTAVNVNEARLYWCRTAQCAAFPNEIQALRQGRALPSKSPLLKLHPFLDEHNIVRLGGRLRHSTLPYDEKHPIILPNGRIAELIVDHAHLRALHGGPQLTLRIMRQMYWVIGARNMVRFRIYRCVACTRHRASTPTQIMGDLPSARVTPSRAFLHTGVDYAGPYYILPVTSRGQRTRKNYVALFVCLSTRAIHLERVGDYTTTAFLAALNRFVARRGIPSDLYSDNGTTFQGADRELSRTFRTITKDANLASRLAIDGTTWHFIPPATPHFGGLWEAGVKAMKHHLRRVVGNHTLSIEEFNTLLCQVEACLNSRPIFPMSNDPHDFTVLTPGHFLIGVPLTTVPAETVLNVNENRLSRYQRVRHMYEHFWRAWHHDYLHSLQQRHKWVKETPNIRVGRMVLLKNHLLPPCKWDLARVIACCTGKDGKVRVVTVRTATSTFVRPIAQICPLPIAACEAE